MSARRVLLTGAGRGIGRAVALAFAREGAALALLARSRDELEAVAEEVHELGGAAHVLTVDLASASAITAACEEALAALGGGLDVLVNNAGIFDVCPIEQLTLELWERFLAINLTAPMLVTQASLLGLAVGREPVAIFIASIAAETGFPGNTAYCASKYGLRGFADALREELAPRGIAVRSVYPRGTDTTIFDAVEGDWDRASMDLPESVAELVLLASRAGARSDLRMP